jgi:hypothetical protein
MDRHCAAGQPSGYRYAMTATANCKSQIQVAQAGTIGPDLLHT